MMGDTKTYTVPAIHCGHCADAIKEEVSGVWACRPSTSIWTRRL
jgi:copper chaperone CopZ